MGNTHETREIKSLVLTHSFLYFTLFVMVKSHAPRIRKWTNVTNHPILDCTAPFVISVHTDPYAEVTSEINGATATNRGNGSENIWTKRRKAAKQLEDNF